MTTAQTRRWQPSFPERWRHGGWYTNNRYDCGASGCVHNNHIDCPGKRWFVAGSEDELGGFSTRTEAAYAERCMILEDRLSNTLAALIALETEVQRMKSVCGEVFNEVDQSVVDEARATISKYR